jgi:hypothetical protein
VYHALGARGLAWLGLATILVALIVATGGWWLRSLATSTDPVRIVEFFAGTVTDVDTSSSSICVAPDDGGGKRCGAVFQSPGSPRIQRSDHISIAREIMKTSNPGVSRDVWVIYNPQPTSG